MELTSPPCRVSKLEAPRGAELPDVRAAADVARSSIVDHMRDTRAWDPAAGPLIDGQVEVSSCDVPVFTGVLHGHGVCVRVDVCISLRCSVCIGLL